MNVDTRVYRVTVFFHPVWHAKPKEEGHANDEDISGGIQIHILQVGQTHGCYHP